jgi:hypothetical protein
MIIKVKVNTRDPSPCPAMTDTDVPTSHETFRLQVQAERVDTKINDQQHFKQS